MSFVYILRGDKKYYVGSTVNVEERLKQHLSGKTHTTKRMGKLSLVFKQEFVNLQSARKVERWLKGLKRKDYIEKIIEDGVIKKRD